MVSTPDLIHSLTAVAEPKPGLRHPILRVCTWLGVALGTLVSFVLIHGQRPDLATKIEDFDFAVQVWATLFTAVTAATAAFYLSLPDRSTWWAMLPLPSTVVWASGVSYGCIFHWSELGADRLTPHLVNECLPSVLAISVPLLLTILFMLRHAAPLRAVLTISMGAYAVAALAAGTLTMLHDFDTSILALLWNFAMTGTFVLVATLARRGLLRLVAHIDIAVRG